ENEEARRRASRRAGPRPTARVRNVRIQIHRVQRRFPDARSGLPRRPGRGERPAMTTIGIIPARMASSRFPNKPLAPISGMPMIGHVYFRSKRCKDLDAVYIATCDREIEQYAESIGAPCVMTSDQHQRASERS